MHEVVIYFKFYEISWGVSELWEGGVDNHNLPLNWPYGFNNNLHTAVQPWSCLWWRRCDVERDLLLSRDVEQQDDAIQKERQSKTLCSCQMWLEWVHAVWEDAAELFVDQCRQQNASCVRTPCADARRVCPPSKGSELHRRTNCSFVLNLWSWCFKFNGAFSTILQFI